MGTHAALSWLGSATPSDCQGTRFGNSLSHLLGRPRRTREVEDGGSSGLGDSSGSDGTGAGAPVRAGQDGDLANEGLRGIGFPVGLPGRFVPSVPTARAESEGVAPDGATNSRNADARRRPAVSIDCKIFGSAGIHQDGMPRGQAFSRCDAVVLGSGTARARLGGQSAPPAGGLNGSAATAATLWPHAVLFFLCVGSSLSF